MRYLILAILVFSSGVVLAASEKKINLNLQSDNIYEVVEFFSQKLEQSFVLSPAIRGEFNFQNEHPVSKEEAFNQFSAQLAKNRIALEKHEGYYVIEIARKIGRGGIEVTHKIPSATPERMVTFIYQTKIQNPEKYVHALKPLLSSDGEMGTSEVTNQLMVTDWATYVRKIGERLKQLDR